MSHKNSLQRTCKAIGIYYEWMENNTYYDTQQTGKFSKWFNEQEHEIDDMEDELEDMSNCSYLEFDMDFPFNPSVNNGRQKQEEMFGIIKYCYLNGIPPNKYNKTYFDRKRLQRMNKNIKSLINGYIRSTQQNMSVVIIPKFVNEYVMLYYPILYKFKWDSNASHPEIIIENELIKNNITAYMEWRTAYSVNHIFAGRIEWKLKIIYKSVAIQIGIIAGRLYKDTRNRVFTVSGGTVSGVGHTSYGYCSDGDCYTSHGYGPYACKPYGEKFDKDDTITVHLNMDIHQLSFSKNNINYGNIPYKLKTNAKYYLAVSLLNAKSSVKLIDEIRFGI